MEPQQEQAKLERFLQWLQVNRVELRGCQIKYCDFSKGYGIFSTNDASDGILLVVPLDLAITPMRVLQDPALGPECRAMFEEGEVDDRFLMILFLIVERLRKNSSWKPYLDMLPNTFCNPLWFTNDELLELKGTTLLRATELQKKKLQSLYEYKVKSLVKKLLILDGDSESEVSFEDFLWANSVFWSRALNIPLPHAYVFPQQEGQDCGTSSLNDTSEMSDCLISKVEFVNVKDEKRAASTTLPIQGETVWVEGLVPGIDFCNHGLKPAATWEVDRTGSIAGVPYSMYLLAAETNSGTEKEISISYGNKGNEVWNLPTYPRLAQHILKNEELLYLYGFVMDDNPDDYLMVHYPVEAFQSAPFSDTKAQLIEAQKGELRCLLPKSFLAHGFFQVNTQQKERDDKITADRVCNYSWSGQRKIPSYVNKLVFPDDFLTVLRTIAMTEDQLFQVSSLLQELVANGEERQPSDIEVRAAIWEACGDSGALQLLVDLLNRKMMDLEEGTGPEDADDELLSNAQVKEMPESCISRVKNDGLELMSRNKWGSIVYRRGQKQLVRLFLMEAETALHLSLSEGN